MVLIVSCVLITVPGCAIRCPGSDLCAREDTWRVSVLWAVATEGARAGSGPIVRRHPPPRQGAGPLVHWHPGRAGPVVRSEGRDESPDSPHTESPVWEGLLCAFIQELRPPD